MVKTWRAADRSMARSTGLPQYLRRPDIVDLERLVDLHEPFGPVRGAAAAALIERQFQLPQETRDLLRRAVTWPMLGRVPSVVSSRSSSAVSPRGKNSR